MTHKQKAIELLSQMPEPFKTLALENLEEFLIEFTHKPKDIIDVLKKLKWCGKYEIFCEVYFHYLQGTPLPELPLQYQYEQLQKENEELKRKLNEIEENLLFNGEK